MFEPAVKWSGSKRSQAKEIIELFPKEINIYYEPFCGGCSVLRRLLSSGIVVKKYICSDLNQDLINLWVQIRDNPSELLKHYEKLWYELNKDDNKERKKRYFEYIRMRYNTEHNPNDFLFIMRTTTNGMPRYNSKGEFNNSFHISRNGIEPNRLKNILLEWSYTLQINNVSFICQSFDKIKSSEGDLLYLDPPYYNAKGMYFKDSMDFELFFNWLRSQNGRYLLSFDGKSGDLDNTYSVPKDVYSKHIYLCSGNSSFKRYLKGNRKTEKVYESLYLK